ncbi:peptidoglycan-binding protein [Actinoplanes sp. NPDC049265]|uniref:peptidoglycan-binding domain-containing protein n=1 Tax=Actinoplanes sp. NPDC049265 TaxID=3363902 RepID=UPI00371AC977
MLQPWPVVHRGDKAHPVPTLQYLLREQGRVVLVDGEFGPRTDAAVRALQHQRNLAEDGVVGPVTWRALITTRRRGDRGEAVRAIQEEFQVRNASGNPSWAPRVDGHFGPITDGAVRAFQHALRAGEPTIVVDGVVNAFLWQALLGGMLIP